MKKTKKKNLKIGVTGGIGSGKSTLCSNFANLGIPILYADNIAKELSVSDLFVRKSNIKLFGESAYNSDGSLNREFIASIVFSDKSKLRKIEAIIRPRVEKEIDRNAKELAAKGHRIIIIEAALIYEAGLDKKLDFVIVIDADESERINRVRARDVVSEEDVRKRMSAQLDVKKKLEKADYTIYNNGSMEELELKARFLYSLFNQLISEDKSA